MTTALLSDMALSLLATNKVTMQAFLHHTLILIKQLDALRKSSQVVWVIETIDLVCEVRDSHLSSSGSLAAAS
jgi:hypothetical protein